MLDTVEGLDLVIVSVLDIDHFRMAKMVMERGIHCMLEKPISPDPWECMELMNLAQANNCQLIICHVLRYTTIICLADDSRLWLESEYMSEAIVNESDKLFAKVGKNEYNLEYVHMEKDEYVTKILSGEEVKTRFRIDTLDVCLILRA